MAKQRRRPVRRRDRKGGPATTRRKSCPYCREKVEQVDYKDLAMLRRFISDRGKIRSRRITGACRRHQSQVARAVKRARELALLPYVVEGSDAAPAVAAIVIVTAIANANADAQRSCLKTSMRSESVVRSSTSRRLSAQLPAARKLAEPATATSLKVAQRRQAEADRVAREAEDRAREGASILGRTVLTIAQQAGDDGRLFGSVTRRTSPTRSAMPAGSRSTAARCTSRSRSATSAPTWSSSRSRMT